MIRSNQTQQILEHLAGKVGITHEKQVVSVLKKGGPHLLVIFAGNPIGMEETMAEMIRLKNRGWIYDLAFSGNAEALMDKGRIITQLEPRQVIDRDMRQLKQYDMNHLTGVYAPLMTHNTARKLTLGIQDGLIPNLLWQALWDGIPVYMNLEGLLTYHGRTTKNGYMVRLMQQTIDTLKEMGVTGVNRPMELSDKTRGEGQPFFRQKTFGQGEKPVAGRKVITEKDIMAHLVTSEALVISNNAIVTPLAKDTAAARGVKLIRE
jgi:hypothetical protein